MYVMRTFSIESARLWSRLVVKDSSFPIRETRLRCVKPLVLDNAAPPAKVL